ncbi:MAG: NAD-dependent epimerase/dehydratase family protein [Acidimicrobiia bacterium]|nr:NAD-dependent epimerase/dehydratase family protein [Acidimicrobiia bacterium]
MVSVDKSGDGLPVAPLSRNVVVTGSAGFIGTALLKRLSRDISITSLRGIDILESDGEVSDSTHTRADVLAPGLENLLSGADTVVHLAGVVDAPSKGSLAATTNVDGAQRLLDASASAGVTTIVRVIPTTIYGAWPTNPDEITEDSAIRPVPGFLPAVYAAEVERRLLDWRFEHPEIRVVTLRSAPVLGRGADHMWSRVLAGPMRLRVRGTKISLQFVHPEDVASAISFAIVNGLDGAYNLCANGVITPESVDELLGRSWVPALPAELLERLLIRASRLRFGEIPAEVVPYLQYPVFISNKKLLDAGWIPSYSSKDALEDAVAGGVLEGIDSLPARSWLRRGGMALVVLALSSLLISRLRKKK